MKNNRCLKMAQYQCFNREGRSVFRERINVGTPHMHACDNVCVLLTGHATCTSDSRCNHTHTDTSTYAVEGYPDTN